jgi:hypothetical protein
MHCPSCGTRAAENQKFCRACGFGLEKLTQVFQEQLAAEGAELPPELQRMERFVGRGISILLTSLLLATASVIVYFQMLVKGQFWTGLGLLGALAWLSLWIFFVGKWSELQKIKEERKNARSAPVLSAPDTNKFLTESSQEPISSVAEHTTRSLDRV